MMKATVLAGLVVFAAITACKKTTVATAHDSTVPLYSCEQNKASESDGYICFDSLVTDSRCPSDVQCVWMGMALIKVSFHESGNVHRFSMILPDLKGFGAVNDTIVNGHRIVLKNLTPYPRVNNPYSLSDYSAQFTVSR